MSKPAQRPFRSQAPTGNPARGNGRNEPNNILCWNCSGLTKGGLGPSRIASLHGFISTSKSNPPSLIAITETRLSVRGPQPPDLDGYYFLGTHHPDGSNGGGIGCFVRKSIKANIALSRPGSTTGSPQLLVLDTSLSRDPVLLAIIYIPPSAPQSEVSDLLSCLADCTEAHPNRRLVCLGDFNGHHPLWSTSPHDKSNQVGDLICDFAAELGLVVLNTLFKESSRQPTFMRGNTESVLDLALASHPDDFCHMRVVPLADLPGSDHRAIQLLTSPSRPPPPADEAPSSRAPRLPLPEFEPLFRARIKEGIAASPTLNTFLNLKINGSTTQEAIDAAADSLSRIISDAARSVEPTSKSWDGRGTRWIRHPAVEAAVRDLESISGYVHQPGGHIHSSIRPRVNAAKNALRSAIAAAKAEDFAKRGQELADPGISPARLYEVFRSMYPSKHTDSIRPEAYATELAGFWASTGVREGTRDQGWRATIRKDWLEEATALDNSKETDGRAFRGRNHDALNADIDPKEVEDALKFAPDIPSSGLDRISYKLLRAAGDSVMPTLWSLLSESFKSGLVPGAWKASKVVPVPKNPSLDPQNPASYRPISLTSVFVRILERVLLTRLRALGIESNQSNPQDPQRPQSEPFISPHQYAFQANRGTEDVHLILREKIAEAFRKRSVTSVCAIDFSKAFDRIPRKHLINKLAKKGIGGRVLTWINSFLTGRKFCVASCGMESSLQDTGEFGVPQGSILAPLLFIIYVDDLLTQLSTVPNIVVAMYADDLTLISTSHDFSGERARQLIRADFYMDEALNIIAKWSFVHLMPINLAKCSLTRFGHKAELLARRRLNLALPSPREGRSSPIPVTESVKILGLTFHCTGSWDLHFATVFRKAQLMTNMIRRAAAIARGPTFFVISRLVTSLVRPILSFGLPIWSPTQPQLLAIDRLLAAPLRASARLPINTNRILLLYEAGIPKTELWIKYLGLRLAYRVHTFWRQQPVGNSLFQPSRFTSGSKARKWAPLIDYINSSADVLNSFDYSSALMSSEGFKKIWRHLIKWTPSTNPIFLSVKRWHKVSLCFRFDTRDSAALRLRLRLNKHHLGKSPCGCHTHGSLIEHIILECPLHSQARYTFLQSWTSTLKSYSRHHIFTNSSILRFALGELPRLKFEADRPLIEKLTCISSQFLSAIHSITPVVTFDRLPPAHN